MSKHTYGFPAGTDKLEAIASAVKQACEPWFQLVDGENVEYPPLIGPDETVTAEIVETDAHRAEGEFVVVIRTSGTAAL